MICSNCKTEMKDGDMFCPNCGAKAPVQAPAPNSTFCPNCGVEVFAGEKFCQSCGYNIMRGTQPDTAYRQPAEKKGNGGAIAAIIAAVVAVIVATIVIIDIITGGIITGRKDKATEQDTQEPVATETVSEPPVFNRISVSSTRSSDKDSAGKIVYYYPDYAMDGDLTTAWSADRKIDSKPSITLQADAPQHVKGIRMTNGYCKSEKTYTKNRRITQVKITYNGGEQMEYFDIDKYRVMIDIPFYSPVDTSYITIQVLDSYYGDWKDIAISEIEVY